MNNDKQYIEEREEQQSMPSPREVMECKRVFNRKHVPSCDTEKEWEKFCRKQQDFPKVIRSKNKLNLIIGFAVGVAATIALFLAIPQTFIKPEATEQIQVFNAICNANDVVLTSEAGETYIISGQTADSVLLAKGINANKDSLVYNRSAKIIKPQWITLTTPRGKDYQVTLPDGSKVWLNADSKLIFPEQFTDNKRIVTLYGEAYFNIAEDEKYPFEVKNIFFTTSVLGTEFNVKACTATDAYVVLINGKVALQSKAHPEMQFITPGQKALLNEKGEFAISRVDPYSYIQWKEGYFYFNNVPLIEIMQELGRWYNVDIIIENSKQINTRLHFVADRDQDLMDALSNLNILKVVHASIKDGKIIIK